MHLSFLCADSIFCTRMMFAIFRLDPIGVCADFAAVSLNASVYTYEVAPVFTLLELEVFENMRNIIGFPPGKGDGLFCPGG